MLFPVPGRFARESFRPWVVSPVGRFAPGRFALGRFARETTRRNDPRAKRPGFLFPDIRGNKTRFRVQGCDCISCVFSTSSHTENCIVAYFWQTLRWSFPDFFSRSKCIPEVMRKQWTGTRAIRRQMGNNQNHKQTRYNENKWLTEWKLFPIRWSLSNPNRNKSIMNKHKVTETLTPKTRNREPHQNHRLGTVSNELLGGGLKNVLWRQPHPQLLI